MSSDDLNSEFIRLYNYDCVQKIQTYARIYDFQVRVYSRQKISRRAGFWTDAGFFRGFPSHRKLSVEKGIQGQGSLHQDGVQKIKSI